MQLYTILDKLRIVLIASKTVKRVFSPSERAAANIKSIQDLGYQFQTLPESVTAGTSLSNLQIVKETLKPY